MQCHVVYSYKYPYFLYEMFFSFYWHSNEARTLGLQEQSLDENGCIRSQSHASTKPTLPCSAGARTFHDNSLAHRENSIVQLHSIANAQCGLCPSTGCSGSLLPRKKDIDSYILFSHGVLKCNLLERVCTEEKKHVYQV
jgi:hypothetical protein